MMKLAWAIFLCAFFLLRPFMMEQSGLSYRHDDDDYFAHASSIAFGQFPSYKKEYFTILPKGPQSSIGAGVLAAPFVFVFSLLDRAAGSEIVLQRTADNIPGSWSQYGFIFASCFYFSLACFFLYVALRFYSPHRYALWAVILTCLSQGMPLYVFRRPLFSHCSEFFLQSVLVFLFLKNRKQTDEMPEKTTTSVTLGILSGLLFLTRYNDILMALFWPFLVLCRRMRDLTSRKTWKNLLISFFCFGLLVLIFKVWPDAVNHYQPYGWVQGYLTRLFPVGFYFRRLWHILFWPDWGLVYTAPYLLIGVSWALLCRFPLKRSVVLSLWPALVNLYIIVIWRSQGAWYGYRFFTALVFPLVVLPVALFLHMTERKFQRPLGWVWIIVAFPAVLAMLMFEGNYSDLNLLRTPQYFGYTDYGNNLYVMSVWKTFLFRPGEWLTILFKGGGLYFLSLFARMVQTFGVWSNAYFRNYPQFDAILLVRVLLLYVTPFAVGWGMYKKYKKNPLFIPEEKT